MTSVINQKHLRIINKPLHFRKDHKMALCQLEDVEAAINALIEMHNHKLAENAHLRVSFSKSGI
jgi:hypothetical protein